MSKIRINVSVPKPSITMDLGVMGSTVYKGDSLLIHLSKDEAKLLVELLQEQIHTLTHLEGQANASDSTRSRRTS